MILLLWLACQDPELARLRAAKDAYEEGRSLLVRGEATQAAARFAEAARLDPHRAEPVAWQAWALQKGGQTDAALDLLDQGIRQFPDDLTLRYNRAALRAGRADREGAADDQRYLYAHGLLTPEEAGEDPDFAPLAQDPEWAALVPPPVVEVDLSGEEGPVLVGSVWHLELAIRSRKGVPLAITDMADPPGLLRPIRVVEDRLDVDGATQRRALSVDYEAAAPGVGWLGPWLVVAGGTSALTERLPVEILALGARVGTGPGAEGGSVRSVEALSQGRTPPWAGREGPDVMVLLAPGTRADVVSADGARDPRPRALELRDRGQTVLLGELHALSVAADVTVSGGGGPIYRTSVPVQTP